MVDSCSCESAWNLKKRKRKREKEEKMKPVFLPSRSDDVESHDPRGSECDRKSKKRTKTALCDSCAGRSGDDMSRCDKFGVFSVNQVMYVVLYPYFDIGDFDSVQRNGAANSNGIVGRNIASTWLWNKYVFQWMLWQTVAVQQQSLWPMPNGPHIPMSVRYGVTVFQACSVHALPGNRARLIVFQTANRTSAVLAVYTSVSLRLCLDPSAPGIDKQSQMAM